MLNFAGNLNFRMFVGTWGLMATILSQSYTTTLIANNTVIKLKKIPTSFEELASDPSGKLIVERNVFGYSVLVSVHQSIIQSNR